MINLLWRRAFGGQQGAPIERKKVVKERMVGIATEPKNSEARYTNVRDLK